jgi:hypothetical protein
MTIFRVKLGGMKSEFEISDDCWSVGFFQRKNKRVNALG